MTVTTTEGSAEATSPDAVATCERPGWLPGAEESLARPGRQVMVPVTVARQHSALRQALETIVLALLIFVAVQSVVQNFRVEGTSMDPNLTDRERLLVNKAIYTRIDLEALHSFLPFVDPGENPERYLFGGPERGDVVVFEFPDDPSRDFIKRVIGLPGDTVHIQDGVVFINGHRLREPYIRHKAGYNYGPKVVPADSYFVLGDNRSNSNDSHLWGFVPGDNLIGQAWVTYWPKDEAGAAPNLDLAP